MASSGWQAWNGLYTSSFGYNYFKCSIRIDSISHSGNTVTISGAFGVLNDGGYESYYVYPINARIRDVTNYQQVVAGNHHIAKNDIVASGVSFSLSVPASNSSASFTIDWLYNNSTASNAYTYTVYFDPSYSAPTGLTVSIAEKYTDGAKFNVSVSSYGNPSSASGRYIEGAILNQSTYGATYKYATASNTSSSAITVTNSSSGGTLTIQPNTQYYYGAYASNTQVTTNKVQGQFVTLASSPTVTVGGVSGNSATINYSTVADGGYYDKTIEYSTDGGTTWQTGATVTGGSAQSGSFTIDNLPGGDNAVQIRTNTTSGSDTPITVTVTIPKNAKLYGGVKILTQVSSSGFSGCIQSFGESQFYRFLMENSSEYSDFVYMDKLLSNIVVVKNGENDYTASIRDALGGAPQTIALGGQTNYNATTLFVATGIKVNVSSADTTGNINVSPSSASKSKEVKKLYGPMQIITDINPRVNMSSTPFIESVDKSILFAKMQSQAKLIDRIASGRKATMIQFSCSSSNNVWGGLIAFFDANNAGMFSETMPSGSNSYQDLKDWAYGWGIVLVDTPPATTGQQRIYLYGTYSNKTKRIVKLYGSANGVTALCYIDDES